ncbi:MAG: hypothetical protein ACRDJW_12305 [Thermomicrobiales bacterium]
MAQHVVADDELIAYATGSAPEARRAEIASHVQECAACAATVATFRGVRETIRWDAVEAPSATTIVRLKRLMPPAAPAGTAEPTLGDAMRQVVARLVFDGRPPTAAVGLRGATAGYALVYAANDIDVDLQMEPPPPGGAQWLITGQVSLPADEVAVAIVLSAAALSVETTVSVDNTGMFSMAASAGDYDLRVRTSGEEIILPGVEVG